MFFKLFSTVLLAAALWGGFPAEAAAVGSISDLRWTLRMVADDRITQREPVNHFPTGLHQLPPDGFQLVLPEHFAEGDHPEPICLRLRDVRREHDCILVFRRTVAAGGEFEVRAEVLGGWGALASEANVRLPLMILAESMVVVYDDVRSDDQGSPAVQAPKHEPHQAPNCKRRLAF